MKRASIRGLLVAPLWLLVAPLAFAQESSGDASPDAGRPNIVFAFADDWGRYASAYAMLEAGTVCDAVETPNFDRIAREGVLLTNAYVNSPSCTPCRSSLLSGQYFFRCERGAILQGAVWNPEIPSYPLLLEQAGYKIGFTHKVWGPGTPANAPYGGAKNAFQKHGSHFNTFSQFVSAAEDPQAAKQTLFDEVRQNFDSFLDSRDAGEPFCYWFGPTNCHRKWVRGSGQRLWGIEPDALRGKLPAFLPDVPEVREDMADYLGEVQAFDAALGVLLERLEQIAELENTFIVVSGDHGVPGFPNGKCNLYDFGVHVPLAVRWGGKIPGGRVVTDFVNLMDLAPTFLDAAGQTIPEVMTGQSVLPILRSEAAGRVDPARDHVVVGRERHVAAAREGGLPYPHRAVLATDDFLYIRNFAPERWPMGDAGSMDDEVGEKDAERLANDTFAAFADMDASPTKAWIIVHGDEAEVRPYFEVAFGRRGADELYDLKRDPQQTKNVADDPAYAGTLAMLRGRLMTILREANDPRVTEDPPRFEQPPYAGPLSRP